MTDLNHLIVIYLTKDKKELVSDQKVISLLESQKIEFKVILSQDLNTNFFIKIILAEKKPSLIQLNLLEDEYLSLEDQQKKLINPLCHLGEELNYPFHYLIKNEPILETLRVLWRSLESEEINIIDIKLIDDPKIPSFAFFESPAELLVDENSSIKRVDKDIQVTN